MVTAVARDAIDLARAGIAEGKTPDVDEIADDLARARERAAGVVVVNATGVLLHTNLGRAVWSSRAVGRALETASHFTNLELDLATGERGRRGGYVEALLTELTGGEAALVVNNNAAALLLALAAMAAGRSVPVSRGELIEIGGSYRLPDVMVASGAGLVEVGTTNRTRVGDYVTALQIHDCGAILKVHPSNYRLVGFHTDVGIRELAGLAGPDLPLIFDLGSGLLDASAPWVPEWLGAEPGARQAIGEGAGLVLFSGDKLLGGPQAGIVVGSETLVAELRSNPLARALRVDGPTYAALAATLELYLEGKPTAIPFWSQALADPALLEERSRRLAGIIGGVTESGASVVGAGSAPGMPIPGTTIRLDSEDHLFECLLRGDTPVLTRRDAGDLLIDLRAVPPEDDELIASAVLRCR
jgi:L-seryl-tRNA(Ser) seleniumtransferase